MQNNNNKKLDQIHFVGLSRQLSFPSLCKLHGAMYHFKGLKNQGLIKALGKIKLVCLLLYFVPGCRIIARGIRTEL